MKVILLQKVAGLGNADDVKEVAEGYARNFLFTRHLAVQASKQALDALQGHKERVGRQAEKDLQEQQSLAARMDGLEVNLKEKASEKGALYAAVTPVSLVEKLKTMGFVVEKEQLLMKPIKILGSYPIKIKFRHGLEAEITVNVTKK